MGDVVNLRPAPEEVDLWSAGEARCLVCSHEWAAAAKLPIRDTLECPKCGCHRGAMKHPFNPPKDYAFWVCKCGGDLALLVVDKKGKESAMCASCGSFKSM